MNQDLEQLKKTVGNDFLPEDRTEVSNLEDRLRHEIVKERFARNTVVMEYMQSLRDEIARAKEALSEDETLTDEARRKLFARKTACRDFLSHFEPRRAQVEQTIKQTLDDARRQS